VRSGDERGKPRENARAEVAAAAEPADVPGRDPGGSHPISVTGPVGEAEWPGPGAGPELPDRGVLLTALALMATVLVGEAYLAAGPAGFVAAGTVLALLAVLVARASIPRDERPPPSAVRASHRPPGGSQADFPAHQKITSDLDWAGTSPRHYDHGLRSRLAMLLDARLAQRYGLDAKAQPERARELIGAELWPLLDASRPPSNDSRAPGVSPATLDRIVTRLEEL
jgi:hypothetical protein